MKHVSRKQFLERLRSQNFSSTPFRLIRISRILSMCVLLLVNIAQAAQCDRDGNSFIPGTEEIGNDLIVSDTILFNLNSTKIRNPRCSNPLAVVASPQEFSEIKTGTIGLHVDVGSAAALGGNPGTFVEIELPSALQNPRAFTQPGSDITALGFSLSDIRTSRNQQNEVILALQGELTLNFSPVFCRTPELLLRYENNQLGPFDRLRGTVPFNSTPFPPSLDRIAGLFVITILVTTRTIERDKAHINITYFIHADVETVIDQQNFDKFNYYLQNLINNTVIILRAQT